MAAGRDILTNLSIPCTEKFSHTLRGQPWIDFEWLFQAGMALVQSWWGFGVIPWLKAVVLSLALLVTASNIFLESGDWRLSLFGFWFSFLLVRSRALERPEIVSIFFLPLFLYAVLKTRRDGLRRRLLFLPGLMVLWVNSHGGFILGLGVLALACVGVWCEERLFPSGRRLAQEYGLCFLCCGLATLLNPYGASIYRIPFLHAIQGRETAQLIQEWRVLTLTHFPLFWVVLVVSFGLLIRDVIRHEREGVFWAPLVLVFGFWASQQVRNPAFHALVIAPYVFGRLNSFSQAVSRWIRTLSIPLALSLTLPFAWALRKRDFHQSVFWFNFPRTAANYIEKKNIWGGMYNTYEFGGYLDWRFGGERPVFFDGRYIFLPLLHEEVKVMADPAGRFREWLDHYGVTYAIVKHASDPVVVRDSNGNTFKTLRSPWAFLFPRRNWALMYWDDTALVYLRRTKLYEPLIRSSEYKMPDPDDVDLILEGVRQGYFKKDWILLELARHARETGPTKTDESLLQQIRSL